MFYIQNRASNVFRGSGEEMMFKNKIKIKIKIKINKKNRNRKLYSTYD